MVQWGDQKNGRKENVVDKNRDGEVPVDKPVVIDNLFHDIAHTDGKFLS